MTTEQFIAAIEATIAQFRAELEPSFRIVLPGEDLQAVLDTSTVPVHLVPGETYPGVTLLSGARLVGNGAFIKGVNKPALYVAPGSNDIQVSDIGCTSNVSGAVVQLGDNSSLTQGTIDRVPTNIKLTEVEVPTHRGKRAFEIHAVAELINCCAYDVYSPAGADSQGVWIHNTPGPVCVVGGVFEAGSENIMVGGDTIKIPGNVPSDLLFDWVTLQKPLSWQTDGVNRYVKNLFELKAGRRVQLLNSTLDGCWVASQTGWAIVITPRNANFIEDVLVQDCEVLNVAGLVQLMGKDYNSVTPQATQNVVFRRVDFDVSKAKFGGTGSVTTMTGGMRDITFDDCHGDFDGGQIVTSDTSATYGQQGPVSILDCQMPTGIYGIKADGANYGNALPAGSSYIGQELLIGAITGNAFTGAPNSFRTNFPDNVYQ